MTASALLHFLNGGHLQHGALLAVKNWSRGEECECLAPLKELGSREEKIYTCFVFAVFFSSRFFAPLSHAPQFGERAKKRREKGSLPSTRAWFRRVPSIPPLSFPPMRPPPKEKCIVVARNLCFFHHCLSVSLLCFTQPCFRPVLCAAARCANCIELRFVRRRRRAHIRVQAAMSKEGFGVDDYGTLRCRYPKSCWRSSMPLLVCVNFVSTFA